MLTNKLFQKGYTTSSLYYQIKLPLGIEILLPTDEPVRLLSAFVKGMEVSTLYQTYEKRKENQATLRQLFKLMVYTSMNRMYSSHDIETSCIFYKGNPHPIMQRLIDFFASRKMFKENIDRSIGASPFSWRNLWEKHLY